VTFNCLPAFARLLIAALLLPLAAVAAAPKAYVGNFKDNTVSVIDTEREQTIGVIPVAEGPHGMVLSLDGSRLYVSGDGSDQVSVVDTVADRLANSLQVGKAPHGLGLTPDGKRLLVAVYGEDRIAVFDTASGRALGSVAVVKPHTIAIDPSGRRAYVASQAPGRFSLAVIDLANLSVLKQLPLEKPPRDLEFAFDGRALYFTIAGENAVQVLDPRSDQIVARVPTGVSPHIASLFRGAPAGTVVVQGPGELSLFDPDTHAVLRSIGVGRQPHWAAASANGRVLYVTNEGSNDVSIVDLAAGTVHTLAVGSAPRKVVVQKLAATGSAVGGPRVSIANFSFTPAEIVIAPGDSVTWTNDDGAPHGLVFADGGKGSDLLLPGIHFSRPFDKAGTFEYSCAVHPYMVGKVVVRSR
jgi:YVTN family beta-propeller protein